MLSTARLGLCGSPLHSCVEKDVENTAERPREGGRHTERGTRQNRALPPPLCPIFYAKGGETLVSSTGGGTSSQGGGDRGGGRSLRSGRKKRGCETEGRRRRPTHTRKVDRPILCGGPKNTIGTGKVYSQSASQPARGGRPVNLAMASLPRTPGTSSACCLGGGRTLFFSTFHSLPVFGGHHKATVGIGRGR